jgi:hypothetical protein
MSVEKLKRNDQKADVLQVDIMATIGAVVITITLTAAEAMLGAVEMAVVKACTKAKHS